MINFDNREKLNVLPFQDLELVADFVYFDGPLVSYFQGTHDTHYIYYWCDMDENYNRWLVIEVSEQNIDAYRNKLIPLRSLILSAMNDIIYMVDIDDNLDHKQIRHLTTTDLPVDYIPDEDSFYDSDLAISYDKRIPNFGMEHELKHWKNVLISSPAPSVEQSFQRITIRYSLQDLINGTTNKILA